MVKPTLASTAVIICLAGCDGQRAESAPPEDPSGVELEYNDPESTEAETTDEQLSEPEAAEPEPSEPGASETPKAPGPAKARCADLTQKTCEVTVGCAWSTQPKGCIEQ